MIIRILGASGAGKSRIVHRLLGLFSNKAPVFSEGNGRKYPLYYMLQTPGCMEFRQIPLSEQDKAERKLKMDVLVRDWTAVLGHYEITNGGVDTLRNLNEIYGLVRRLCGGANVVFEGKGMSDGSQRIISLFEDGLPITVIALTTPIDECVRLKSALLCSRAAEQMRRAGVMVEEYDREGAFLRVCELLGVDPVPRMVKMEGVVVA